MAWEPLPEGTPFKSLKRLFRGRDSELLGRTILDDLDIQGDIDVAGTLDVTGVTTLGADLDLSGNDLLDAGTASVDSLDLISQGSNPSASDGPDDYPDGLTLNTLSSASGWPIATGHVETFRFDAARAYQVVRPKTVGLAYERYWASASTWSNWNVVAPTKARATFSTHNISVASTFEVAGTHTISVHPTSGFSARIVSRSYFYGQDTAATSVNWNARTDISLDGGSTWQLGSDTGVAETGGAGEARQHTFAVAHEWGGSVTGTIQARLMVKSNSAASFFANIHSIIEIGNQY